MRENDGASEICEALKIAAKYYRFSDIEKETRSLEEEQKEIESRFGTDAGENDYKRYAEISAKLNSLYEEYFELGEE